VLDILIWDMAQTDNIYCDESGHMENDPEKVVVLGAVWCPLEETRDISYDFRWYLSSRT